MKKKGRFVPNKKFNEMEPKLFTLSFGKVEELPVGLAYHWRKIVAGRVYPAF